MDGDDESRARPMYAVDDLGDAVDVTRDFLAGFDARSWLVLALVVFFVAGLGFSAPPAPAGDPTFDGNFADVWEQALAEVEADADTEFEIDWDWVLTLVLYAVAILVTLWLAFSLLAALMEFVLLESLRRGSVSLRRYGRTNLGRGLRLFGFRLALILGGLALVSVPARSILESVDGLGELSVGAFAPVFLVAGVYYALYRLVDGLTTAFVAPVMLLERRSVLGAWRRFWPTLVGTWREYLVYVLLVWVLRLLVGIVITLLTVLTAVVIGIPTVAAVVGLVYLTGTTGLYIGAVLALGAVALLATLVTLARVPVESYFRYYALLVLGDTNAALDLIPDRRGAVRNGDDSTRGAGVDDPTGSDEDSPAESTDRREDGWTDARSWDGNSREWGYVDDDRDDDSR